MNQEIISKSVKETQNVSTIVLSSLSGNVITLYGDLGSGKTTFSQGIAKELGITKRIVSPTFIIVRKYDVDKDNRFQFFYHIDLYRTESVHDIEGLGLDEIIADTKNLVVIEWPEKMGKDLPTNRQEVQLEYVDEITRKITIV